MDFQKYNIKEKKQKEKGRKKKRERERKKQELFLKKTTINHPKKVFFKKKIVIVGYRNKNLEEK